MAICIRAYVVWKNYRTMNLGIVHKFPNDHEFGFDTSSYDNWLKYLRTVVLEINGKMSRLPRTSKNYPGGLIAYRVYRWGGRYMEYFPGKEKNGKKRYLKDWGVLISK